jgi:hypothetical protein
VIDHRAVRCGAVRCGAVRRGAVRRSELHVDSVGHHLLSLELKDLSGLVVGLIRGLEKSHQLASLLC